MIYASAGTYAKTPFFFFYMYLVITLFVLHQSLPGDSQDEEDEAKLLTVSQLTSLFTQRLLKVDVLDRLFMLF